jgi:lipid-A-disaccharide synthase-like uncharacterized protein
MPKVRISTSRFIVPWVNMKNVIWLELLWYGCEPVTESKVGPRKFQRFRCCCWLNTTQVQASNLNHVCRGNRYCTYAWSYQSKQCSSETSKSPIIPCKFWNIGNWSKSWTFSWILCKKDQIKNSIEPTSLVLLSRLRTCWWG